MNISFDLYETIRHLLLIFFSFTSAFILALILAKPFLKLLNKFKIHKQIREIASTGEKATLFQKLHLKKAGTPTMGGILIWGTTLIIILGSRVLSAFGLVEHSLLNRKETWLPIATLVATALLGAVDDYFNIKGKGKSKGINIKPKFLWLTFFAVLGGFWFHYKLGYDQFHIPGNGDIYLGLWYIPLFALVILASSNAVNITDGLDGLAGGLLVIAFGSFSVIAFAKGLLLLSAFCGVVTGASLAFLWNNIPPAKFFIETLSIIIQIFSKKVFKKKVFKIAPLHHHYEAKGWPEAKVVMRFWIVGGIFAMIGLILALLSIPL
jgi:phospho-N-acetylmuramoyl-pentapeptide-transferase